MKANKSLLALLLTILYTNGLGAGEINVTIRPGPEGIDKWFGSVYNRDGVNDDKLRVGGWGDIYYSLLKFQDVSTPLPAPLKRAELWLYAHDSTRQTDITLWQLTSPWSETPGDHVNLRGYNHGATAGPQVPNGWWGRDITAEVTSWRNFPSQNFGILLAPTANDNRFDTFYSSDSSQTLLRPQIRLIYDEIVPAFKMPLPGGRRWKLTTEAGGRTYRNGPYDKAHENRTYFSLDFSPRSTSLSGSVESLGTDVPVLAAYGGKVFEVGFNASNGYFVRIDHDGDGNPGTGYQTVYLHLNGWPLVSQNQIVVQGQKLGIMGNTGDSEATHLHITFYYRNDAPLAGLTPELLDAKMENRQLTNYKLSGVYDPRISQFTPVYYPSSNY